MPVPRRRHCPARRDRNRTHKKLVAAQSVFTCPNPDCAQPRMPHRVCGNCGEFRGRYYGNQAQKQSENA